MAAPDRPPRARVPLAPAPTPSPRARLPLAFAAALAASSLAAPAPAPAAVPPSAEAPPRPPEGPVAWTAVMAPPGDQQRRLERTLRSLLEQEAATAKWGRAPRGGSLEGSFALRRFERSLDRGVLRVHCAAAGRLRDGRPVRSVFTLSGRPSERAALERRALAFAVRGVVVRLAELARAAARPTVRVTNEPGEF